MQKKGKDEKHIPSIFEIIKIEAYYTYYTYIQNFWDPSMRGLRNPSERGKKLRRLSQRV